MHVVPYAYFFFQRNMKNMKFAIKGRPLFNMHYFIEGSYENSTNYKISAFASKKHFPNEISVCDTHMAQNLRKTRILGQICSFLPIFDPEDTFRVKLRKIVFIERSTEFFCILWYILICTHMAHIF